MKAKMSIKQENDLEINTLVEKDQLCSPGDLYCRVCFKIFSLSDQKHEIVYDIRSAISEFLFIYNSIGSQSICNKCNNLIKSFRDFKDSVSEKQELFEQLILNNQHNNLTEIQKLSNEIDNEVKVDTLENEVFIKQEPLEDLIIQNAFTTVHNKRQYNKQEVPDAREFKSKRIRKKVMEEKKVFACPAPKVKYRTNPLKRRPILKKGSKNLKTIKSTPVRTKRKYQKKKLKKNAIVVEPPPPP
jgi:hypothetical protein